MKKRIISFILFFTLIFSLSSCDLSKKKVIVETIYEPTEVTTPFFSEEVLAKASRSFVSVHCKKTIPVDLTNPNNPNPNLTPYDKYWSDGVIIKSEHLTPTREDYYRLYALTVSPVWRLLPSKDKLAAADYDIYHKGYKFPCSSIKKIKGESLSYNQFDNLTEIMDFIIVSFDINTADLTWFNDNLPISAIESVDLSTLIDDNTTSIFNMNCGQLDFTNALNIFSISSFQWSGQTQVPYTTYSPGYISQIVKDGTLDNLHKYPSEANQTIKTTYIGLDLALNDINLGAPIFDYKGRLLGIFINKKTIASSVNLDHMSNAIPINLGNNFLKFSTWTTF